MAATTLTGCASFKAVSPPKLPQAPAELQKPCKHPLINETDARSIIARYVVALRQCDAKRGDLVRFYDDLRKGLK